MFPTTSGLTGTQPTETIGKPTFSICPAQLEPLATNGLPPEVLKAFSSKGAGGSTINW
jgi:hypothetical protein